MFNKFSCAQLLVKQILSWCYILTTKEKFSSPSEK